MKLRHFLLAISVGIAIGALLFLVRGTQSVNLERFANIQQQLRDLKQLDGKFNEEIVKARLFVDVESEALLNMIAVVQDAPKVLIGGESNIRGVTPDVDVALDAYLQAMEEKVTTAADYELENLRLVNSLEILPRVSNELLKGLSGEEFLQERILILSLLKEAMIYGVLPEPPNEAEFEELVYQSSKVGNNIPDNYRESFVQLSSVSNYLLSGKRKVDTALKQLTSYPTDKKLEELQAVYGEYHEAVLAKSQRYRQILVIYAVVLLLVLGIVGLRLRKSYQDLDKANDELKETNEHLEDMVAVRTKDLQSALGDLKESQSQLIQSEKMASLGQMIAGVAHEINTPLGYVRSNNEIFGTSLQELSEVLRCYADLFRLMNDPTATDEEVAASMQELAEVQNDVNSTDLLVELHQLLGDNDHGLKQITELVANLKDFSRLDRSRDAHFHVNDGIEATLKISQNVLKTGVEVIRNYGELPDIECAPSQLNQVFLNMVTNAAQAMDGVGQLFISTKAVGDKVAISFRDTGCGMDEETRKKIFDPFFTTKPIGEGTGLGLSIVFKIIEEHGGHITAKSQVGVGTEFTVVLPQKQPKGASQQAESGMKMADAVSA